MAKVAEKSRKRAEHREIPDNIEIQPISDRIKKELIKNLFMTLRNPQRTIFHCTTHPTNVPKMMSFSALKS